LLARRQPARAAGTIGVAVLAGGFAFVQVGGLLPAIAATALLIGATGEFLFPVAYRLTPEGAEARNLFAWRRIAWKDVKRVAVGEEEILLSPLARAGRRDAFRGVLLRCEGNRDAALAAVRRFRDAAARS
jgi:hypothetical protein